MRDIRVVIDTNIFISCLLKSPANLAIYHAFKEGKFTLIISDRLLEEINEVFKNKGLKINPLTAEELITVIGLKAITVNPRTKLNVCRDKEDNFIIETAVEAKATHIVTNDKDILELKPAYKGIPILSSWEFLSLISK